MKRISGFLGNLMPKQQQQSVDNVFILRDINEFLFKYQVKNLYFFGSHSHLVETYLCEGKSLRT